MLGQGRQGHQQLTGSNGSGVIHTSKEREYEKFQESRMKVLQASSVLGPLLFSEEAPIVGWRRC